MFFRSKDCAGSGDRHRSGSGRGRIEVCGNQYIGLFDELGRDDSRSGQVVGGGDQSYRIFAPAGRRYQPKKLALGREIRDPSNRKHRDERNEHRED